MRFNYSEMISDASEMKLIAASMTVIDWETRFECAAMTVDDREMRFDAAAMTVIDWEIIFDVFETINEAYELVFEEATLHMGHVGSNGVLFELTPATNEFVLDYYLCIYDIISRCIILINNSYYFCFYIVNKEVPL